jgi:RNA polymerase sigma-70 factor (ECF subfamily)
MTKYEKSSDQELVSLLNKGDQSAYTEIYNRYHAVLYIHVFNKIRIRETARDIVHDLFSNVWLQREHFKLQSTLAAYLYSAVRYRVFDLLSHRKVESKYIDSIREFADKGHCITDHLIREKQLIEMINREIAALPSKMRQVFELSRSGNLSHRQVAELLNLSEKTVKKQVNNSLKILRSKLGVALFTMFFL